MELGVAVRRARERGRDEHEEGVHREEGRDERRLARVSATGTAKQLDDDDRGDDEGNDEEVDLPAGEVVGGEPRDLDEVVAAPEIAVAAEVVLGRRPVEEQSGAERRPGEEHRPERRPEPAGDVAERGPARSDGPAEQRAEEEGAHQRRELRTDRVGDTDRTEHRELTSDGRSLEREDDGEQCDARGEIRRALGQHERGVDRRGDRHGERGDADAPPRRQKPPCEQVDRHRREREQRRVDELHERVRELDATGEPEDRREQERIDGPVAVLVPPQVQPFALDQRPGREGVAELVRVQERQVDELRRRRVAGRRDDDDRGQRKRRPATVDAIVPDGQVDGARLPRTRCAVRVSFR